MSNGLLIRCSFDPARYVANALWRCTGGGLLSSRGSAFAISSAESKKLDGHGDQSRILDLHRDTLLSTQPIDVRPHVSLHLLSRHDSDPPGEELAKSGVTSTPEDLSAEGRPYPHPT